MEYPALISVCHPPVNMENQPMYLNSMSVDDGPLVSRRDG
jgi:hypothetical protein